MTSWMSSPGRTTQFLGRLSAPRAAGCLAATALAFVGALPAAVHAQDFASVAGIERSAEEGLILDELTARLAAQLGRIDAGRPSSAARREPHQGGANNNNLLNNEDCTPLSAEFQRRQREPRQGELKSPAAIGTTTTSVSC